MSRTNAQRLFHEFLEDESGVTMIEYGVAAALMSSAIVAFMSDLDDPNGLLGRIKLLMDSII